MMVEPRAADPFITDVGDANLSVSFFDIVTLFKGTVEDTLLLVQYFGQWYSNKKKEKWNVKFFHNCANLYVDMLQQNTTQHFMDMSSNKKTFLQTSMNYWISILKQRRKSQQLLEIVSPMG